MRLQIAVAAAVMSVTLAACGPRKAANAPTASEPVASQPSMAPAGTPQAALRNENGLPFTPDPTMTPGDTLEVTREDICVPGYARKVRNVPAAVKRRAYEEYGIRTHKPGDFEVDHLISLELGGSNSIRNLWPETAYGTWNYHVKDQLENRLHHMVCSGDMDLKEAQKDVATDWIGTYKRIFRTDRPLSDRDAGSGGGRRLTSGSSAYRTREYGGPSSGPEGEGRASAGSTNNHTYSDSSEPGSSQKVWVNTRSGAYWRPGTEYYGKTKQGEYMTEADAIRAGYHPAGGGGRR